MIIKQKYKPDTEKFLSWDELKVSDVFYHKFTKDFCMKTSKNSYVSFRDKKYDDDVEWVLNMFKAYNINLFPQITNPIYFYNFMREDSVMYWRKLEEYAKGGAV